MGGVLPPFPVNGEGIAKNDDAVSSEIIGESFASAGGRTDGKDDSVVGEQGGLFAADGKNPDEVQKDDFIASGETSDASASIENLSEEKSEVNNESLAPAQETSGKDSPVISEQDGLLAANNENPNEAHENDSTARGETDSTSVPTENSNKEKGSGIIVYVDSAKKKLATNNGKTALLKSVGTTVIAASAVGGFGAAAVKLGSSESKAAGASEELEELKRQNEELQSEKKSLEIQNNTLSDSNNELARKISELENNKESSGLKWWHALLIAWGCVAVLVFLANICSEKPDSLKSYSLRFVFNALFLGLPRQLGIPLTND